MSSPEPAVIAPARPPDPQRLFARRAARLSALAEGHPAAPFLALLSRIARGQELAVREVRIPPGTPLPRVAGGEEPPGTARSGLGRVIGTPAWRAMLRIVLGAARAPELPAQARGAIARLEAAGDDELEALADAVLAGAGADPAAAPFVGAALQAWFTVLAAGLDDPRAPMAGQAMAERAGGSEGRSPPISNDAWDACPACGFAPVAGTVRGDDRLRYLSCGLCATEWHVPRVHCTACRSNSGITYFEVEGAAPGVRAEACPTCRAVLKMVDLLQAPHADPLADDAATLVLDVLLGEQGWRRAGRNLLSF